jgi:hypothetical protein
MHTLLFCSDPHPNHKLGLNPPNVLLDEGDSWAACSIQRMLHATWMDILETVAKEKRGETIGIMNGDYADIDDKQRTNQIISRNEDDIRRMAIEVIEPMSDLCNKMYFVRGTEAHAGKSAHMENTIAANFDNAVICPDTKQPSWWYLPLEVDGVKFDITHHPKGGAGGRPFNSQTVVDRLAADTIFDYANNGERPPDFVIRSHLHHYLDSKDAFVTRAIITPPLSLLTAYGRRIGITREASVGAIMIFVDNGKSFVKPIIQKARKQQWQVL